MASKRNKEGATTRGQRVEALVEPSLLIWTREAAGFDVETAAKKAAVKPERLAAWESGSLRPTMTQLRNLAKIYRRPIAVFYLPAPPPEIASPRDYRRLPGRVSGIESPDLRFEVRRATTRRELALQLLADEGEQPATFPVEGRPSDLPADLARALRESLGVGMELQSSWREIYAPFNGWRSAIESAGALVLQMTEVEMSEARGFSISEFPLPTVVVNIKDGPRARVFSMVHELAHVAIRLGGLCDLDDTSSRLDEALRIEAFCNAVAGATLVPEEAFTVEPIVEDHSSSSSWSDEELSSLAKRYGVSREVILRRLLDLGRTDLVFYKAKRQEFLDEYEAARRRQKPGFAPPHQLALASAGPSFTGLVLNGYAQGHITAADVSDYLGVRLKHLARIEHQLSGEGRAG